MERETCQIEFQDVVNYWMSLFPEISGEEELDNILTKVSNSSFGNIKANYESKSEKENQKINGLTDCMFSIDSKEVEAFCFERLEKLSPFSNFFKPILASFFNTYYQEIRKVDLIEDTAEFMRCAMEDLFQKLVPKAQRTIILEINIAKMDDQLIGESSEERFEYFTKELMNDSHYLKSLYVEYSELIQLLMVISSNYFQYIMEMLKNTEESWKGIEKTFFSDDGLKIRKIETGLGDGHRGGKSVAMMHFSNEKTLVYKPRSLALEEGFNDLVLWLNDQGISDYKGLMAPALYAKEDHGWMTFIDYKECNSEAEIEQFYSRTGHMIGLLYALNAKDAHHENIIAHGSHPILVDLEALFHSRLKLSTNHMLSASDIANDIVGRSVYSIGFLPHSISNPVDSYNQKTVDVSALSGDESQKSPFSTISISGKATDEISIVKDYGFIKVQDNNPRCNGEIYRSESYIDEIKDGFKVIYDWIMSHKELFIDKVTEYFSEKKSRCILRPTYMYGQILTTSLHPDFLRESIHRKVLLHRLGINVEERFLEVVESEIGALAIGDVPYFVTPLNRNTIENALGKELSVRLVNTPLEEVIKKINQFSDDDFWLQNKFIDLAFKAKNSDGSKDETGMQFEKQATGKGPEIDAWLDTATEIGNYILKGSIVGDKDGVRDRTWISTVLEGREEISWSLAPVGHDLYNGNSGIALFLGYLWKLRSDTKHKDAAIEALQAPMKVISQLDEDHPYLNGAYNGISGYFYAINHLGHLFGDQSLIDFVKEHIMILDKLAFKDTIFDVIGGSAGCLGVLLSIYETADDPEFRKQLLEIATKNYEMIKTHGRGMPDGSVTWGDMPFTGFAHGTAGIAAYLGKLYKITQNEEILVLIENALKYERSLYSEKDRNWYSDKDKEKMAIAWCYGSPGILLSRCILKESGYHDEFIDHEFDIALESTIDEAFGHNPCHCHGDIGNLSIVRYAARVKGDKILENRCVDTFGKLHDEILTKRWQEGVFRGTESMGLMIGTAGFGYGILEFCDSELIPEILRLE